MKNDDTGATITTTTTNADGEWEFANRDETIRYRVEAAFGGSSSQVVVRKPASAEFDHLYANLSFRTAAAATVVLGGPLSVTGALTVGGTVTAPLVSATNVSAGDLIVSGTLSAPTATITNLSVTSTLTVTGASTLNGLVTVDDILTVTGFIHSDVGIESAGSLSADGLTSLNGGLQVAGNLGFYGTAPAVKPTVTGAKAGNAALTSLMTALANLGLVVNSTS